MADTETSPMDRIYDLVTELLREGADPREILDNVRDAIRVWRQVEPMPVKVVKQ